MSESTNSPTHLNQFPRSTNRLLSPSDKVILDKWPDELVKATLEFDDADIKVTNVTMEGVSVMQFIGQRAVAVRDYFEMQFAYGLRKDPRE